MWRKHRSVYHEHINNVRNDILKPFNVKILRYDDPVREMYDLSKYIPPPLMKGKSAEASNCTVRNQDFTANEVRLAIKDRLPKSMQDELDDHPENYCSLTYEYWWDLLSTIEFKDERKRAAAQIKNIASARASSFSDSSDSERISRKKKARTGVLRSNKPWKKAHKHHSIQRYCVLCKKEGMPEQKYMSLSS